MVYGKKTIFEEIIMAASPRTWLMSYTLFCFCTISFDLVSLSIYDNILTSVLDLFLPFCHSILPTCHLVNIIKASCLIFSPLFSGQYINVLISFFLAKFPLWPVSKTTFHVQNVLNQNVCQNIFDV